VKEAGIYLKRERNISSSVNVTHAKQQIDFFLAELGYRNLTFDAIDNMSESLANFSAQAEETAGLFNEFSGGFFDLQDTVGSYKDEYNEFKYSWNGCLIASVVLTGLLSIVSLVWPIITAVNTRHNLRTGKWRLNRDAYVPKYQIHTLAEVPGIMFGVVIVSYIFFCLIMAGVLFLVIYGPVRNFIWKYLQKGIVSFICAIIFKSSLKFLVFDVWQLDKEGKIKNFEAYSVCFSVMLFFNIVYGILGKYVCSVSLFVYICIYIIV
jgi:hypothetical protein